MEQQFALSQQGVLGSMILDPRCIGSVITHLRPADFDDGLPRDTYTAIREMFLDGEKIDPVTVLHRMGDRENCRGWILGLMDATPTAANVREYVGIVREQARLQAVQRIGAKLIAANLTTDDARALAGELDALLMDRRSVEDLTMEQCLINFYDDLERKPEYLSWGLDFLDDGLTAESSDYIVLGGYPSDGKTALALQMAYTQAKTKRVAFFSLETKSSKLFSRIFSSVAQVPGSRIRRRTLTGTDFDAMASKSDEVRANNLHLIKASSMSVEDIAAYARARQFEVIYIDYLTLMPAPGRTEFDQATYNSKGLHRLAQDNGITVVALSQLSRPEDKKKPVPTLGSLRSSGQIEQDADIVMFVYREDQKDLRSPRILRVAKNKEGPTGQVRLTFDGETQTFHVDDTEAGKQVAAQMSAAGRKAKRENRYHDAMDQASFEDLPDEYKIPF